MDNLSFIETSDIIYLFTNIDYKKYLPYTLCNNEKIKDILINKYQIDPLTPSSKYNFSKLINIHSTGNISLDKDKLILFIHNKLNIEPFSSIKNIICNFITDIKLSDLQYLNLFHIVSYKEKKYISSLFFKKNIITSGLSLFGYSIIEDYYEYVLTIQIIDFL